MLYNIGNVTQNIRTVRCLNMLALFCKQIPKTMKKVWMRRLKKNINDGMVNMVFLSACNIHNSFLNIWLRAPILPQEYKMQDISQISYILSTRRVFLLWALLKLFFFLPLLMAELCNMPSRKSPPAGSFRRLLNEVTKQLQICISQK